MEPNNIEEPDIDGRPNWNQYFMELTSVVAKRSTCLRREVGALLVKDGRVLATGYNGAPSGLKHCSETGCIREKRNVPSGQRHELCRGLHAEQNAIIQAALHGTSIDGATLYCTHQPCVVCAKMIINAGINEIIIGGNYPDKLSASMLEEAGIEVNKFNE
ncbi:deoxycytidylate deaminase [Sporohalobacter salinus]|uniref:deoxycytidylate deaminase n=1 Tax=Sporohalobacter salinus TaxID=1494606 RepID=UPI001960D916|nr:cytidine/deoxycytidylate deaminase family protein [Sporohalobacter salinus]MBM7622890.1 dCMP deaminase [Sporohalobacter salinus]